MIAQKIFLSHIPKSAGCSTRDALNPDAVLHWSPLLRQKDFCMERYISENSYLNFFKISFVRNPWDRLVSCYHFFRQGNNHEWPKEDIREIKKMQEFNEFNDFVLDFKDNQRWWMEKFHFLNQHTWTHSSEGKLCLDYLGKVETIQKDVNLICDMITIPHIKIKKLNKSKRGHYMDYYNKESKEIVSSVYEKDIEYFGYKFGS